MAERNVSRSENEFNTVSKRDSTINWETQRASWEGVEDFRSGLTEVGKARLE